MKWAHKQTGFTIVELLIVVVVIAILAAITIVAFNGVQNSAKQSALQAGVKQATTKLTAAALTSGELFPEPQNFSSATGISSDTNTTYTYIPSTDRKNFCVSATNSANPALSYATTGRTSASVSGRCVTNMIPNPSFEAGISGWAQNGANASGQSTDWASSGANSLRITPSATSSDSFLRLGGQGNMLGLIAGETYTISATSRLGAVQTGTLDSRARRVIVYSWTGTTAGTLGDSAQVPNTVGVYPHSATFTIPATITGLEIRLYNGASNTANNSIYWDGIILHTGTTAYQFRDGASDGWFWNGTEGASNSTGPAIQ